MSVLKDYQTLGKRYFNNLLCMKNKSFYIDNFFVSDNSKPLIVAEIGQAHDGSLGIAHSYIDAVADAGADAVKFQTHIASEESTIDEGFRVNFSYEDSSRFDYWKRMEFSKSQWLELKNHANKKGLIFLSSPFSVAAFDLLSEIGMSAWKVGSGEISNFNLLDKMIKSSLPILVSTGMSPWSEVENIFNFLDKSDIDFLLMQCTSQYPTDFKDVGLNVISELKKSFNCLVGFSDHSGSIYPSIFAMQLGASVIEVHVVFDKKMFGPDTSSSLTFPELKLLTDAAKSLDTFRKNPVDKNLYANNLSESKQLFGRSIALASDLSMNHVLTLKDLTLKKPGSGISFDFIEKLVGKRLKNDVKSNRLLKWEDIYE